MTKKKPRLLLGAHISAAGGLEKIFERAESIGCTTLQFFSKSNRQWKAKEITSEEISLFQEAKDKSHIAPLVVHASYLINLAAPDPEILRKSIEATKEELRRCEELGVSYLVLHPGSRLHSQEDPALKQIARSLDEIVAERKGTTVICIETMAGQGSGMCSSFEQIQQILKESKHKSRLGVCFDTCHAFAAGYNFSSPESYTAMWDHFDRTIGLANLKVIHLNDSKKECGSRVDRHEDIGQGKIGLEAFKLLMNDKQLFAIPKILETPRDTLEDYAKNMQVLKDLLSEQNREFFQV